MAALVRRGLLLTLISLICFLVYLLLRDNTTRNLLSYSTRPLWDKDASQFPNTTIAHSIAHGLSTGDAEACNRHGWGVSRFPGGKTPVIDAVIFSTELDLLEVRLEELWDVVDKFIILESHRTFMGEKKNMTFQLNKQRFDAYRAKLIYVEIHGRELRKGENPFAIEGEQRNAMTDFIYNTVRPDPGSLIIMSDVDEIPAKGTIDLLRSCDPPLPLHLQLQNFIYSFQFPTSALSWRAQVHAWSPGETYYNHGKQTNNILLDAGWHCSFCFRKISDFIFKMTSYSHSDRLYGSRHWHQLLDPKMIRSKICKGEDLFGMLPEAYTWSELLGRWKGEQESKHIANLPVPVLKKPEKYKFLLPGNCQLRDP